MLVEGAVADAYGAGFENLPLEMVTPFNDLSGYRGNSKYKSRSGRYTDDSCFTHKDYKAFRASGTIRS